MTLKSTNKSDDNNKTSDTKNTVIADVPLHDDLADEVLTGGYSSNGDLTEDVLTDGGLVRGNIGGDSPIEESKNRGELKDDILVQEDEDQNNSQTEITWYYLMIIG